MDGLSGQWDELKGLGAGEHERSDFRAAYTALVRALWAAPDGGASFAPPDPGDADTFLEHLERLTAGGVAAVGLLPQLEMVLLAALGFVARGKHAIIFTGAPADPDQLHQLLSSLASLLGVESRRITRSFGKGGPRLKELLRADILLWDYGHFLREYQLNPKLLEGRAAVALFCEIELCLYDGRLAFFEKGHLQAVAAICRVTGTPLSRPEEVAMLDVVDAVGAFDSVAGTSSYLTSQVAQQLSAAYGSCIEGAIQGDAKATCAPAAFRTQAEKGEKLARAIADCEGDVLLFYAQEPTRAALLNLLGQYGETPISLQDARSLRSFINTKGERRRIGLALGVPTLLTPPPDAKPTMDVFLAEHYLFEHHHAKIRAFLDRDVVLHGKLRLYYSLEDQLFAPYAASKLFARAFDLIEFTERWDAKQQVRRVIAYVILSKMRRLRRACLTEEFPIFTSVNAKNLRKQARTEAKTKIGRQLEGLCFCGSGKPFRECHGRG